MIVILKRRGWSVRWFHQADLTDTESDKVTYYSGHQILWGQYFWPLLQSEWTFQGRKTGKRSKLRWDLAVLHEGYLREGIWKQWETVSWLGWEGGDILRADNKITGQKKKKFGWRKWGREGEVVMIKLCAPRWDEDKAGLGNESSIIQWSILD